MATRADVRRIALSLPGAEEGADHFAFSVEKKGKQKGFVWVWLERVDPKKARVPNPSVIAVRTASVGQRDALIAAEPKKFFTEPHYAGYPAVLVRLDAVTVADLKVLIADAWRCLAPAEPVGRAKKSAVRGAPKRGRRS
ncbi:MAG TPA: MmcQ/YjbR family DNA-binding protein [Gemmatimonadaceae bacterium]